MIYVTMVLLRRSEQISKHSEKFHARSTMHRGKGCWDEKARRDQGTANEVLINGAQTGAAPFRLDI